MAIHGIMANFAQSGERHELRCAGILSGNAPGVNSQPCPGRLSLVARLESQTQAGGAIQRAPVFGAPFRRGTDARIPCGPSRASSWR